MPASRSFIGCALLVMSLATAFAVSGCGGATAPTSPSDAGSRTAATSAATPDTTPRAPTTDDGLSPSYRPDAPVRSKVGSGHVLTGVVVSSRDGSPIANAKLELWPEYAGQGHVDSARATVFTDDSGAYRFECDQPEHIHMRISAPGYVTIAQNSYHPEGKPTGTFDIVLAPDAP